MRVRVDVHVRVCDGVLLVMYLNLNRQKLWGGGWLRGDEDHVNSHVSSVQIKVYEILKAFLLLCTNLWKKSIAENSSFLPQPLS